MRNERNQDEQNRSIERHRRVRRYWNRNLDPLNRREVDEARREALWRQADLTFAAPDTRRALELLGELQGRRVLELGCGMGAGLACLSRKGARVTGIDLAEERCRAAATAVERLERSGAVTVCQADAAQLPFVSGSFDAIFCRDVLMYADPRQVARECARILAPGGRVAFVEALQGNPAAGLYRRVVSEKSYRHFTRHLNIAELSSLQEGLRLLDSRAFYLSATLAFFMLYIWRSRGLYQRLLERLSRWDTALIEHLPFLRRYAWHGIAVYEKAAKDSDEEHPPEES